MYLDTIEENMAFHSKVSKPPRYVRLTPILFNAWEEWAQQHEDDKTTQDSALDNQNNTDIRPLGEKICPSWVKYEFKDMEEFYQHYTELIKVGDKYGDQQ